MKKGEPDYTNKGRVEGGERRNEGRERINGLKWEVRRGGLWRRDWERRKREILD